MPVRPRLDGSHPLARLARVNPTAAFLAGLAYVLVALLVPGVAGGALLLVLVAGLGALAVLTWPVQRPGARALRLVALALLLAAALGKLF